MRKMNWVRAGLYSGLLLSGSVALAQAPASPPAEEQPAGTHCDGELLTRGLRVNQVELSLGKLAIERAATAEVKAMGAKMVEKHTEVRQRLVELARQAGVSETPDLSPEEQAIINRFTSLPSGEFDKSFKEAVDAGHLRELAMYRNEGSRAKSPQLRALAKERVAALDKTAEKMSPSAKCTPSAPDPATSIEPAAAPAT